jgi:hypothetical protein
MNPEGETGTQVEGESTVYYGRFNSQLLYTECNLCRIEREEREKSFFARLMRMFGCESELNRVCLHCEANLHYLEGFSHYVNE